MLANIGRTEIIAALVVIAATAALCLGRISPEVWLGLAGAVLAAYTAADRASRANGGTRPPLVDAGRKEVMP